MKLNKWEAGIVVFSAMLCFPVMLAGMAIGMVAGWAWLAIAKGFDLVVNGEAQ